MEGNGKTISGLQRSAADSVDYFGGLFTYLQGATVRNLTVSASIITTGWAGILASRVNNSTITGVATQGSIEGSGASASVAGLCEYLYQSKVEECTNAATVKNQGGSEDVSLYAAGIACEVNGSTITDCNNSGSITAEAGAAVYAYIGGIAAYIKNGSSVSGCKNFAAVQVTAGAYCEVGGIIGNVYFEDAGAMTVSGNINEGDVSGTANDVYIGGIAGTVYAAREAYDENKEFIGYISNEVTVSGNENSGDVTMSPSADGSADEGNRPAAGGVIGWVSTMGGFTQSNNSSSGDVTNSSVRGVTNEIVGETVTVSNAGGVIGWVSTMGGFTQSNNSSSGDVTNSSVRGVTNEIVGETVTVSNS